MVKYNNSIINKLYIKPKIWCSSQHVYIKSENDVQKKNRCRAKS